MLSREELEYMYEAGYYEEVLKEALSLHARVEEVEKLISTVTEAALAVKKKIEGEAAHISDIIADMAETKTHIMNLQKRRAYAEETLRWYADEANYEPEYEELSDATMERAPTVADNDAGSRARAYFAQVEGN